MLLCSQFTDSDSEKLTSKRESYMFFFLKYFVPQLGYSSHCRVIYWFIQLSHPLKAHRRYSVKITVQLNSVAQ